MFLRNDFLERLTINENLLCFHLHRGHGQVGMHIPQGFHCFIDLSRMFYLTPITGTATPTNTTTTTIIQQHSLSRISLPKFRGNCDHYENKRILVSHQLNALLNQTKLVSVSAKKITSNTKLTPKDRPQKRVKYNSNFHFKIELPSVTLNCLSEHSITKQRT